MTLKKIGILGAGIAGLGAANLLHTQGKEPKIFDKRSAAGGHTSSTKTKEGFIFDEGPHVSFTKDKRIQKAFAKSVEDAYEVIQVKVDNFWKGKWIKHPAICNLHGLPAELVYEIIRDVSLLQTEDKSSPPTNFAEWLTSSYGKTFSETFPFDYNEKYHTTHPKNLDIDWLGPRLYKASFEEVVKGSLSQTTPDVHYVDHFRYPTDGGFESYLNDLKLNKNYAFNYECQNIDLKKKVVSFGNGKQFEFDQLISSIPLPVLIQRIQNAPKEVLDASRKLACSTCVCVSVGVNRSDIHEAQWTYYYDKEISFARTSIPHLLSPKTVPDGCGSIQCEVYFSDKYRPLTKSLKSVEEDVLRDLRKCGLVQESDQILCVHTQKLEYANVIFDLERASSLKIIMDFLAETDLHVCGRFGEWGYHWTDESLLSGEEAARAALSKI